MNRLAAALWAMHVAVVLQGCGAPGPTTAWLGEVTVVPAPAGPGSRYPHLASGDGPVVLSWLQAAVVPCVMAHGHDGMARPELPAHQHPAAHEHPASQDAAPCPYCPPHASGAGSCEGHGGCAYPHEPQVDARAAGALWAVVPVGFVLPSSDVHRVSDRADTATTGIVPRVSLSVSYCRFLE